MPPGVLPLLLAVTLLLSLPGHTKTDEEKARAQLEQLQGDIKKISRQISKETSRKNTLQDQLRKAEVTLGALQKDIAKNEKALGQSRARLADLNTRQRELEKSRDEQRELIARELRAAYQAGQQGQLKVLLNQEDPNTLARAIAYYRYFYQARNKHIEKYREILAELAQLEPAILRATQELEDSRKSLKKEQQNLVQAKKSRELAVSKLQASIRDKGGTLKQMERDQRELEELLEAIEQAVVNLKMPENYKAFSAAKGTMPWPISGRASHRFGKSRNEGKMRWQGVTIPAKEGTKVAAIHHGRVVYADWLRGSGLLIIIDHGEGYMSLYAHNQSLLRDVGEWVSAGTSISTVGSTGGKDSSALYFEVRSKGKPTNPASWCRR
jgi:septal ring factor EnvC (AmiA/AmiB activator)